MSGGSPKGRLRASARADEAVIDEMDTAELLIEHNRKAHAAMSPNVFQVPGVPAPVQIQPMVPPAAGTRP